MKRAPGPPTAPEKPRQPGRIRAVFLAVVVHAAFFALIVFGVTWQSRREAPVQVELWDKLPPAPKSQAIEPEPPKPQPEPPKMEPPKPEPAKPEPPKPEVKPQPPKPDPAVVQKIEREKREKLEREKREKLERKKKEEEEAKHCAHRLTSRTESRTSGERAAARSPTRSGAAAIVSHAPLSGWERAHRARSRTDLPSPAGRRLQQCGGCRGVIR